MNRAQLIAAVNSYAKRNGEIDQEINDFLLPFAEARIGRDLETAENEKTVSWPLAASPDALPDDYGKIKAIWYPNDRGPTTLVSVDLHTLNQWSEAGGGTPYVYAIAGAQIYVRPFLAADYELFYYARPEALVLDGDTNAVLNRYPNIYTYAVLTEIYIWERDQAQLANALEAYTSDVNRANRDASRGRGEKPAMRRA